MFTLYVSFCYLVCFFNLALKTSSAKVVDSEVVIYLSWLWLLSLFSISVTLAL